jgi:hypothetical protein
MSIDEGGRDLGIFNAPKMGQEIYEAMPEDRQAYGIDPADGLPRPAVQATLKLAMAPDYTLEGLVCAADQRQYVRRDRHGRVLESYEPAVVGRMPNGRYYVKPKWWQWWRRYVEVEPIRPACSHYRRQKVDMEDDPDFKVILRLCTARRGEGGEYLSVRDTQVFACELRSPVDCSSVEQHLDTFDADIARQAEQKKADEEHPFDIEQALADE